MGRTSLGDQELALLRFVAERGGGSVGEVADAYGASHGLARSTVLTMMERLRKKRYLRRRQQDGVYRYESTASPSELLKQVVSSFVEGPLGGDPSPFMAYLADQGRLTAQERAQLEALAAKLETRSRGEDGDE